MHYIQLKNMNFNQFQCDVISSPVWSSSSCPSWERWVYPTPSDAPQDTHWQKEKMTSTLQSLCEELIHLVNVRLCGVGTVNMTVRKRRKPWVRDAAVLTPGLVWGLRKLLPLFWAVDLVSCCCWTCARTDGASWALRWASSAPLSFQWRSYTWTHTDVWTWEHIQILLQKRTSTVVLCFTLVLIFAICMKIMTFFVC